MAKIQGTHIPAEIKNLAINGGMDFFQRNTSATLSTNNTSVYCADMFQTGIGGSTTKNVTISRSTNIPSQAQSGFQGTYSLQVVNNTSVTTLAAADYLLGFNYRMEGLDYAKIHAKQATFGFWFNTTVAGVYSMALRNSGASRSYIATFNASVGWQFITLTVQMDTSAGGTWAFDTTLGLDILIGCVSGTTTQTASTNTWQTGAYSSASNSVNWAATAGATLQITQFSIVEGPLGFSATGFQRAGKDIQAEQVNVIRYYETGNWNFCFNGSGLPNSTDCKIAGAFSSPKRTLPTMTCTPGTSVTVTSIFASGINGFQYNCSSGNSNNFPITWFADAGL